MMNELEKLHDYLQGQLNRSEQEMIALHAKIDVLVAVRSMVESAMDRERQRAA